MSRTCGPYDPVGHGARDDDHRRTITGVYLNAQRDAIKNRRGMWANGVPKYVLTSLHSVDERPNQNWAYNRLVSTHDGHSERWIHGETYENATKSVLKKFSLRVRS